MSNYGTFTRANFLVKEKMQRLKFVIGRARSSRPFLHVGSGRSRYTTRCSINHVNLHAFANIAGKAVFYRRRY